MDEVGGNILFVAKKTLQPYYKDEDKLTADLEFLSESSMEDKKLFSWLSEEDDVWAALCPVFERRLGTRKGFEAWLLKADAAGYRLSSEMKRIGAYFVILELREYAGHSLWNRVGKAPHYEDILKVVHGRVSEKFRIKPRDEMSVEDRELSLSAMILRESLDSLSPDKVQEILKETNLGTTSDLKNLRDGLVGRFAEVGSANLKNLLGRSVMKRFGTKVIESAFGSGRLASAGALGSFASKVLPVAFKRAGLYISIGFLLKDAYQLGGEATRITNPAVIIISLYPSFSAR